MLSLMSYEHVRRSVSLIISLVSVSFGVYRYRLGHTLFLTAGLPIAILKKKGIRMKSLIILNIL